MNRVNLITLGVKDIKKSLKFYQEVGFQASIMGEDGYPVIVFFRNEGSKIRLYTIEKLAKDINKANPPQLSTRGFSGITLGYNAKSEIEVDEIIQQVKETGAKVIKEPQTLFWGGYGAFFIDPDGYYWEVAYGPMWKYDESNMVII